MKTKSIIRLSHTPKDREAELFIGIKSFSTYGLKNHLKERNGNQVFNMAQDWATCMEKGYYTMEQREELRQFIIGQFKEEREKAKESSFDRCLSQTNLAAGHIFKIYNDHNIDIILVAAYITDLLRKGAY